MYSVTISTIIDNLINSIEFVIFKKYNQIIFNNFTINTITNVFFNLSNFTYFPINPIIITLIKVPILIKLLILVTAKLLSCNHNCLKFPHNPTDILKKAMIDIYEEFNKQKLKSKMILQVHDELIFNVENSEKEKVEKIVIDLMENAYKLNVPLKVEISEGYSWYDAK